MRQLDVPTKARLLGYMRQIEDEPEGPRSNSIALPPMHAPGSRLATFREFTITYFVTHHDEASGEIQFIRFSRG
jgi:hypothetical protein